MYMYIHVDVLAGYMSVFVGESFVLDSSKPNSHSTISRLALSLNYEATPKLPF